MALSYRALKATPASQRHTRPMPCSMPAMCMGAFAAASISIIGTGVCTSVSLFVLVPLLLVGLVVLLSLLLTGLTGLVGLESLVGLTNEPIQRTAQGDE